jgi:hypothetical protein
MATLKTVNVQHPDSPVVNVALNSDGSVGGELGDVLASKLAAADQTVIQIVRATDASQRQTTSTSFVDADISVTITPQKSDSAILVMHFANMQAGTADANFQITDASNNPLTGAEGARVRANSSGPSVMLGYSTPATTSPVTYKVRFRVAASTGTLLNGLATGQLLAIEVGA